MDKEDFNKTNRKDKPLNTKECLTFFFLPFFTTKPIWRNDHFSQSELERFEKYGFDEKIDQAKTVQKFGRLFWFGVIVIIITLTSCKSSQKQVLSNMTIDNKSSNGLIENRVPDYGIDGADGDVYMDEISMNIYKLELNYIEGKVFFSENKEPLSNAYIDLYVNNKSQDDTLRIYSNNDGYFEKRFDGNLKSLEVKYVGARSLKVNLEQ
ncbi:hypothetical protein [Christiangramia portivictoriae]|uniref:hypothetical protein n=1 Tax=Christiangramia portivictoriae TaxID=326069 RepID=UPI000688E3A9|nr:hypothetical protein [Christiangramia portivictoriae]